MLDLTTFFHGKVVPFTSSTRSQTSRTLSPSPKYGFKFLNDDDDPISSVRVNLEMGDDDVPVAAVEFFISKKSRQARRGGGVRRDAYAKMREVENYFAKRYKVGKVFTDSDTGYLEIELPTK